MNGTAKSRKLWKMNSAGEPLSANGIEANPLKKFTIPKIRKTTEKGKNSVNNGVFINNIVLI